MNAWGHLFPPCVPLLRNSLTKECQLCLFAVGYWTDNISRSDLSEGHIEEFKWDSTVRMVTEDIEYHPLCRV